MEFIGPAYDSNPSGGSATLVPATGTITTTTLGKQNNLLWPSTRQAIATVGLYNWASVVTSGTGAQSILSGDQVSGFYTTVANNGTAAKADLNYDLLGNATFDNSTPAYVDTIRFNVPGAFTATTGAGGTGYILLIGGILVTPNVGAYNTTIANGNEWIAGNYAGNCPIDVYQNNTAGELFINAPIYYYNTNSRATCFVKGGAGTVVLTGSGTSSANTGSPYLNGGCTVINNNTQIGATGTAAPLYLNGGTLVASGNTSLDNGSGANERPVTLLGNGGGLASYSGKTLTVGGQISSAANTGTLVIGIPASSANGSVAGQLPGTGTGTANTTQVRPLARWLLTGINTYTGNTVISSGTLKLGAAGSINYSPNIIVGAGATYDVSLVSGYTLAAGANLMGSGTVNGAVVVAPGSGIYGGTDGTYGTNTFASNLTLASGAAAYFDLGTSATGSNDLIVVNGTLTMNGNTIHLKAPSPTAVLAPANYLLFSDASPVASNAALTLVWDVPPANSAKYALAVSGNNVILQYVTLTPLVQLIATNYNPVTGVWTDSSGNGNNATYSSFLGSLTLPSGFCCYPERFLGGEHYFRWSVVFSLIHPLAQNQRLYCVCLCHA